jgi:hypothetical protein
VDIFRGLSSTKSLAPVCGASDFFVALIDIILIPAGENRYQGMHASSPMTRSSSAFACYRIKKPPGLRKEIEKSFLHCRN